MAFPPVHPKLADWLAHSVSQAVRKRGRELYEEGVVEFDHVDPATGDTVCSVKSETTGEYYQIDISGLAPEEMLVVDCSCPAPAGCKHAVAVVCAVDDELEDSPIAVPLPPALAPYEEQLAQAKARKDAERLAAEETTTSRGRPGSPPKTPVLMRPSDIASAKTEKSSAVANIQKRTWTTDADEALPVTSLAEADVLALCEPAEAERAKGYLQRASVAQGSLFKEDVEAEVLADYWVEYGQYMPRSGRYGFGLKGGVTPEGVLHLACTCKRRLRAPLCGHKAAMLLAAAALLKISHIRELPSLEARRREMARRYGLDTDRFAVDDYFITMMVGGDVQLMPRQAGLVALPEVTVLIGDDSKRTSSPTALMRLSRALPVLEEAEDEAKKSTGTPRVGWLVLPPALALEEGPIVAVLARENKQGRVTSAKLLADQPIPEWTPLLTDQDRELLALQTRLRIPALPEGHDGMYLKAAEHVARACRRALELLAQRPGLCLSADLDPARRQMTHTEPQALGEPMLVELEVLLAHTSPYYTVELVVRLGQRTYVLTEAKWLTTGLLLYKGELYGLAAPEQGAYLMPYLETNRLRVFDRQGTLEGLYNAYVAPLSAWFRVQTKIEGLEQDRRLPEPAETMLYMQDAAQGFIRFTPVFKYRFGEEEMEFAPGGVGSCSVMDGGKQITYFRSAPHEAEQLDRIETLHPAFADQQGQGYYELTHRQALQDRWVMGLGAAASGLGLILLGERQMKRFRYSTAEATYSLRISSGVDWFDIVPTLAFGAEKVAMTKIRQAVLEGRDYVLLADGSFGLLPAEWLQRLGPLMRLAREGKDGLRIGKVHSHLAAEAADMAGDQELAAALHAQAERLSLPESAPVVPLPESLVAELRPYQHRGYNWLAAHEQAGYGALLADDMGLGKTLQVLARLTAASEANDAARHLIVMPTSLLHNWQAEAVRFSPGMRYGIYHGNGRRRILEDASVNLVLTTYGTLRYDVDELAGYAWDYVVLDESHNVKNPDTAAAQAVRRLQARRRIAMTGTPVENRTLDLYAQLEFLNPGLLGTRKAFADNFAIPIDRDRDEARALELRRLVAPFILKRTKEQVAQDLPAKTDVVTYCELLPTQHKLYEQVKEEYRTRILDKIAEEGRDKAGTLIMAGLTKLRQICDSAAILRPELAATGQHSAKIDVLLDELEQIVGHHKVLVFSNFLDMLALVRTRLEQAGIGYSYMDGSTQDRQAVVGQFQQEEDRRVFLMTLKTGGVGLNLTQADYVFILDPWWNPAAERQAVDRTHRIGQTRPVFAYRMITVGTVEEKILELQRRKQKLAEDLITTDDSVMMSLTDGQVIGLFS